MPVIVATHRLHDDVRDRLSQHGQVIVNDNESPWPRDELLARLGNADAMLAFMTDSVDEALLAQAPRLRVVACALKGFDNFDAAACTRAGVWLTIVPDLLTAPTAELAIGLAIAAARHLRHGDAQVRSGAFAGWRPSWFGSGLAGATVAIVGLGRLGSAIAERLRGFACARLLGVDESQGHPLVEHRELSVALGAADFVFLAVPLTQQSRHLVDAAALATVRPGQVLINVGRGSVVDEAAVADALASGRLGAYAADVFEFEDWTLPGRPRQVEPRLLAEPRTVFTPHLGSAVTRVRQAIEHRAADNLIAVLEGHEPPDAVNRPGRFVESSP